MTDDNQIFWDFEAQDFPLPENGGIGRLQRFDFNDGLMLYRSEFRVQRECIIDSIAAEDELPDLLCSILLLSGEVLLETPDGRRHRITPQCGLVFRLRDSGSRIILKGGQTVRHIGVAGNIPALHKRLGEPLPGSLACFSTLPVSGVVSCALPVQNRLRNLLGNVFSPLTHTVESLQEIALEGVSLSIQAEMIRCLLANDTGGESKTPLWGEQVFDDLTVYIHNHLALPIRAEDICKKFGLSKRQLQQIFQTMVQCSPAEFLRRERLTRARELIEQEGLPVKLAANTVGYNHASNFSKAYRAFFGETPGHTLRLHDTETTEENNPAK